MKHWVQVSRFQFIWWGWRWFLNFPLRWGRIYPHEPLKPMFRSYPIGPIEIRAWIRDVYLDIVKRKEKP